jgi:hypothetical protein
MLLFELPVTSPFDFNGALGCLFITWLNPVLVHQAGVIILIVVIFVFPSLTPDTKEKLETAA